MFSDYMTHVAKKRLREQCLFRLKKRRQRGNHTVVYSCLMGVTGVYKGDETKLLLEMYSGKCTREAKVTSCNKRNLN